MTKKTLIIIGSIGAILLGSAQPEAIAEEKPINYTQSIKSTSWSLMQRIGAFNRIDAKIITTRPWLNAENQKLMLSKSELRNILQKVGFSGVGLEKAERIVFLESTNRPYALNRASNCYGLFQINMTGAMGDHRRQKYGLSKNEDLFNPIINASIAYKMSNGGKNWSSWTTAND